MSAARVARRTRARRGRDDGPVSFLASVGTVSAALRAGAGPEEAWRRVGVRTVEGVPRAADLVTLGGGAGRHVAAVRAAARLSLQVGTPAADMLERVTLAVARDAQAENARRAALAGPRATARLLAWLPAVGLLLGAALGARPWDQLLGGGAGTASGLVGASLLLAGRRWTAREIRAAERAGGPAADGASAGRTRNRRDGAPSAGRRRVRTLGEPRTAGGESSGSSPARTGAARGGRSMPRGTRVSRLGSASGARPARTLDMGAVGAGRTGLDLLTTRIRRPSAGRGRQGRARGQSHGTEAVEEAVLLDLVEGACQAGVGLPRALDAVGLAVGGAAGVDLQRAARTVTSGAAWEVAWQGSRPEVRSSARALRPAWEDGVPPGALLRAAAEQARRDRDARAAEAAARLGVRLVVPLGLCHLPAFVLVGLVPVLGSMATTTLGA